MTLTDLTYAYDPDGQLTAILDNLDPAKSRAISYDALNRLVQVAEGVPVAQGGVPVPVEDYAYDGEGNRTASHLSAMYSSNGHNQLLEDEGYSYAYDAKGNRISRTSKADGAVESYAYDSQNRLVGYSSATTTANYAYDALDRRIAKTVDGVTEATVYDPWSPARTTSNDRALDFRAGSLIRRWLFGPTVDEPLEFEDYAGTTAPGTGSAVGLFANRLGSILSAVTLSTGAVAADYDYDSFGGRTETGTLEQPYGFTGREHDAESGLIHFRARAYDPETGRFLQVDPLEFAAGDLNLSAYVKSNPYNRTDPTGRTAWAECTAGSQRGGACGSMAGTIMPTVSVVQGLADLIGLTIVQMSMDDPDLDNWLDSDDPRAGHNGPPRGAAAASALRSGSVQRSQL